MKNVLVALFCTLGAVACGESRPAETPSNPSKTVTTETTTSGSEVPITSAPSTPTPAVGSTARATPTTPVTPPATPADTSTTPTVTGSGPVVNNNPGAADNTKDATNTKTNDRDRHGALTPMDQGGGKDRDITAAIRRAVVGDGSLSFSAKNVKIITVGGKVTLRGPVKSDAEKATIEAKAKAAAGVTEVDNQLEVKK